MHNAKFDMRALEEIGLDINFKVWDTQVAARVLNNDELAYSLEKCVERAQLGLPKGDLKKYCSKNGLITKIKIPGKKKTVTLYHFDKVPEFLVREYAETDARITFDLAQSQKERVKKVDSMRRSNVPSVMNVLELEQKTTMALYKMEKRGIQLDVEYTRNMSSFENKRAEEAKREFKSLTGVPFVDSAKTFTPIFDSMGLPYEKTELGNPSFKNSILKKINNEVTKAILDAREADKLANTYYQNFLWFMDKQGVIHANIKQGGTATGRFSCSDPNLQNCKKDEDIIEEEDGLSSVQKSQVRRCFIPRPGFNFFMLDWDQMEYRVLLEYAEEMPMIKLVNAGVDIHQATADMMGGVTRKQAKTINFALLYGCGLDQLANLLKTSREDARRLMGLYFRQLPKVTEFSKRVRSRAESMGVIFNKYGRPYFFKNPRFSYKAPNYLIQGGCSDACRTAIVHSEETLKGCISRLLLQIHDELLFEVHESETHLVHKLKEGMERAFPTKHLTLTAGIEWSDKSWQDKKEWTIGQ